MIGNAINGVDKRISIWRASVTFF